MLQWSSFKGSSLEKLILHIFLCWRMCLLWLQWSRTCNCVFSTLEEVKATVYELSGDNASGPDRFTTLFYQECWEVICYDIHNMVLNFYGGATLPKSITHTNLVLLLKKSRVQTFSDLRPISLSNFINTMIE